MLLSHHPVCGLDFRFVYFLLQQDCALRHNSDICQETNDVGGCLVLSEY